MSPRLYSHRNSRLNSHRNAHMSRGTRSVAVACLAVLAVLLGACTLAPVYQRPAAPVAAAYPDTTATPEASAPPSAAPGWRDVLPDPRLARLIDLALANNRDLRVAALNIDLARAQYRIQGAALLPTIGVDAADARQRTPAALRVPGEPAVLSEYSASVGLSSYELDFFGRVRSLKDAALASYLATEQARAVRTSVWWRRWPMPTSRYRPTASSSS